MTRRTITRDVTGFRFGRLTVLEFAGYQKHSPPHAVWKCLCDCGTERLVRGTHLNSGLITQCVACAKASAAKKGGLTRKLDDKTRTQNAMFGMYRLNARSKGYVFELTKEQFVSLISQECFYCGERPAKGIDRKNNSVGYLEENSVSCCSKCNYAKRDMDFREFLTWVRRVYENAKEVGLL